MFHNWYSDEWWTQLTPNCATDQIQSVLEFSLLFGHYPRIPDDMKNVTNVGNLVSEDMHKCTKAANSQSVEHLVCLSSTCCICNCACQ